MNTNIPFGLLFEEAIHNAEIELPEIVYSPVQQISYAVVDKNKREPYVTMTGTLGTDTATRVRAEGTIDDDQKTEIFTATLGTETLTKVYAEGTDSDDQRDALIFTALGTETFTEVRIEATDSDKNRPLFSEKHIPFLGTETVTLVKNEDTDSDR